MKGYNESTDCKHKDIEIVGRLFHKDSIQITILCNDCQKVGEDTYEVDVCSILFEDRYENIKRHLIENIENVKGTGILKWN